MYIISICIFCLSYTGYVQLDISMKNMSKYEGEVIRIKCEITGFPLPQYSWFKDNIPIRELVDPRDPDRISAKPTHWGSRFVESFIATSKCQM